MCTSIEDGCPTVPSSFIELMTLGDAEFEFEECIMLVTGPTIFFLTNSFKWLLAAGVMPTFFMALARGVFRML
jgi:hypothetical protein